MVVIALIVVRECNRFKYSSLPHPPPVTANKHTKHPRVPATGSGPWGWWFQMLQL
ncbi:MAG: hypothetical protein K8R34_17295 [Methanosarcinales archaeon]|nr:hypothetical protein [Methanosarcinales archaeon]MCD4810114.1 hypothetical protein [Methanosarcinales archaeon]